MRVSSRQNKFSFVSLHLRYGYTKKMIAKDNLNGK